MKKQLLRLCAVALVAALGTIVLQAHEETFKGTVITLKDQKLEVLVLNEKTKKEAPMTFEVTAKTKILRGDKEVKAADAHITKDERIAVTINHDVPGNKATVIRLAAH